MLIVEALLQAELAACPGYWEVILGNGWDNSHSEGREGQLEIGKFWSHIVFSFLAS